MPLDPPLHTPLEVIFPKDRFRSRLIVTFADFATETMQQLGVELEKRTAAALKP